MQQNNKRRRNRRNRTREGAENTQSANTTIRGEIRFHPRGFAFVETMDESYFVPGTLLEGVLDGDTVAASVSKRGEDTTVRKIEIASRARDRIIGTWTGNSLSIDPGVGVGNWPAEGKASEGETVVAEYRQGKWRIIERLGDTYQSNTLARRFLERHRLPWRHEEATIKEARAVAAAKRKRGKRRSFVEQTVITIDADHSKDLDDALSIRPERDGHLRLWVHIADVSEHVVEGSLMDKAAAGTPTSVYLPMQVRPMLPPEISEQALSLLPGEERDTLTVEMLINDEGVVVEHSVYESVIKSTQRVNYVDVAKFIHGAHEEAGFDPDVAETVGWLWHAALRIGAQRAMRGGVPSDLIGEDPSDEDDAHMLVERLMVQANETVANWLDERDLPALYRCHRAPKDEDVSRIETTACELGQYVSFSKPVSPVAFRSFYQQIERSCDLPALRDLLAGALGSAEYTTVNYGHFGLGSEKYVHFTSPLRRYADLLVHRAVKRHLHGESTRTLRVAMQGIERHISEVSSRAGKAEREVRVALALREIEARPTRNATGIISGLSDTKIRIEADELGDVGGYVMARKVGGWRFDERRHEGIRNGKILKVGSSVQVSASRIDALRGTLEFTFPEPGRATTKPKGRGNRRGKRTRRRR